MTTNPMLRYVNPDSDIETVAMALSHGLTVHDMRQQGKRSYNPFALGIYMEMVQEFRENAPKVGMANALREYFTQNPETLAYDITEVEKVAKAAGISDKL